MSVESKTQGGIASLDGLRAVAVVLVILAHATHTSGFPSGLSLGWAGPIGTLGVRIFFILSGFLITHLLLKEEQLRGFVSLSRFYFRRFLRIFPAFYAYIIVMTIVGRLVGNAIPSDDIVSAATYTINYDRQRVWVLGHAWSLGVEEQFYLLWPLLFTVLAGIGRIRWALAVLVIGPLARVITWQLFPSWELMIGETFPTIADALATGVLLALFRETSHRSPVYMRALGSRAMTWIPLAVVALNWISAEVVLFGWLLGETLLNVAIALCVDRAATWPEGSVTRLLNLAPVMFVGRFSYSLYLWQQPFLPRDGEFPLQQFPLNIVAAFVAALASFQLVERPFLRLKDRFGGSVGRKADG